jgi:hypothetical protein
MKRRALIVALVLCYSCVAIAADLHVPEEIIGTDTIAIVNLNVSSIKPEQVVKTMTDIMGKAPEQAMADQLKDFSTKFKDAGGKSISIVINGSKDLNAAKSGDTTVVVVELNEGADAAKLTEFVNANIPGVKEAVAADCPKNFNGKLVWYNKNFKLPTQNKDRAETFSVAHGEVAEDQLLSIVVVPDENAQDAVKANLKPEEAEIARAILGGGGVCLFSNLGVADNPTIKVLVLAADAAGAESIRAAVDKLLKEAKNGAPPEFQKLLDGLKLDQAGTNVQFSIAVIEWAKVAKAIFEAGATPPPAKP